MTRTTAIDTTCFYMTEMGKGTYRILLVRHLSVAVSDNLFSLGLPPEKGHVWIVLVRGPFRCFEQIVRAKPACYYPDLIWGGMFGPTNEEGDFSYSPGHVPPRLMRMLAASQ